MQLNYTQKNRGFTLIEVLVSVSIFTIVMLMTTSSVFTIVAANKKTHSLKSVMTNLNFALESMARDIRVGTKYICDGVGDCKSGSASNSLTMFRYKANRDVDGDGLYNASDSNDQVEYGIQNGRIMKRIYNNGQPAFPITAAEIVITNLKFYVVGTTAGDGQQPKALIVIQGYSGAGGTQSNFNIQTTVSMRSIDS